MRVAYRRHMDTFIIAVTYTFEMGGGEKWKKCYPILNPKIMNGHIRKIVINYLSW